MCLVYLIYSVLKLTCKIIWFLHHIYVFLLWPPQPSLYGCRSSTPVLCVAAVIMCFDYIINSYNCLKILISVLTVLMIIMNLSQLTNFHLLKWRTNSFFQMLTRLWLLLVTRICLSQKEHLSCQNQFGILHGNSAGWIFFDFPYFSYQCIF